MTLVSTYRFGYNVTCYRITLIMNCILCRIFVTQGHMSFVRDDEELSTWTRQWHPIWSTVGQFYVNSVYLYQSWCYSEWKYIPLERWPHRVTCICLYEIHYRVAIVYHSPWRIHLLTIVNEPQRSKHSFSIAFVFMKNYLEKCGNSCCRREQEGSLLQPSRHQ